MSKPDLRLVDTTPPPAPEPPPPEVHEQAEMPFAVVEGEPLTQLPKDLYIPPDALQVFLEAFEGPLDLLLYLIRRQNLDILDIPLAEITRQYMQYIEVMQELQLELAGEYMLMAATLAEIKSRMLLPRPQGEGSGDEDDPRAELVRRLQEYERFKRAAEDIEELPRVDRDTFPASAELVERRVVKMLPQVTMKEMLVALKEVMASRTTTCSASGSRCASACPTCSARCAHRPSSSSAGSSGPRKAAWASRSRSRRSSSCCARA